MLPVLQKNFLVFIWGKQWPWTGLEILLYQMEKCEESRGIKKLPIIRGVKNYPPSKNMNYRFGNNIYEVSQSFLYFDYLIRHKVLDEVTKLPVECKLETSTIILQNSYLCIHLTFILS